MRENLIFLCDVVVKTKTHEEKDQRERYEMHIICSNNE